MSLFVATFTISLAQVTPFEKWNELLLVIFPTEGFIEVAIENWPE